MSYIPQFDAHESTHTKLQESRHIPTLTCLASITRLPTFEEAASGFPNKHKGKFEILFSKIDSNAGHKTILGPTAQGWSCVQVGL